MIIKSNYSNNSVVMKYVIYTVIIVHIAIYSISCSVTDRCIYDIHGVIIKKMDKNHAVYVTKDGNSLSVNLNDINYQYSKDKLIHDINNKIEIDHECNIRQMFFILFDQDLNIIEVRAADISHPDYIRCPNINKYIDLIKSTQGNWVFKNTNTKDELHLFVFSMLIY